MSFRRIRERLRVERSDAGLGITEVVVALMVFTVIAVGMAYSMATMTRLVSDTRSREVAAGLAAQEIDKVRAVPDAFDVYGTGVGYSAPATSTVVGTTTYTISRVVSWVDTNGSTANCGGGGGNLQYKRVNVSVTWGSQLVLTSTVKADTILAPSTRINDPSYGTILVSTLGADGTGRSNVTVTVTPTSGGAAVGTVNPTDADGCAYILKVAPGTYQVKVAKTGYIDYNQITSPSLSLTVAAGSSQTANFAYDAAASFALKYAPEFTTATPKLPSGLTTNYLSSKGTYSVTSTATPISLYPLAEGYSAIAGNYSATSTSTTGCLSVDPLAWQAGTVNATDLKAGTRTAVGVAAGGSGTLGVPMGVIQFPQPATATTFRVKSVTPPTGLGDPGCATATSYTFSFSPLPGSGNPTYLAVPFGSWEVYGVSSSLVETKVTSGLVAATRGEVTGTIVTLDPRSP